MKNTILIKNKNKLIMDSINGFIHPLKFIIIASTLIAGACASGPNFKDHKVIIDNSARGGELPPWVYESKTTWEKDDSVYFKSLYSIKGTQRLNGCFDLAKLEMSETVLENIKHDIKGELSLANEGIAEAADPLMTKSISKTFNGMIKGLITREQSYERYKLGDEERLDCYILSSMNIQDYRALKNHSLEQLISVSEEVAKAVRKKQVDFFQAKETN